MSSERNMLPVSAACLNSLSACSGLKNAIDCSPLYLKGLGLRYTGLTPVLLSHARLCCRKGTRNSRERRRNGSAGQHLGQLRLSTPPHKIYFWSSPHCDIHSLIATRPFMNETIKGTKNMCQSHFVCATTTTTTKKNK